MNSQNSFRPRVHPPKKARTFSCLKTLLVLGLILQAFCFCVAVLYYINWPAHVWKKSVRVKELVKFVEAPPVHELDVEEKPAPVVPDDSIAHKPKPLALNVVAWQPRDSFRLPDVALPPFPPALPERVEVGRFEHINSMSKGITLNSNVHFVSGTTASVDRKKTKAYQVKLSLELMLPDAADGAALLHANPHLPKTLKNYDALMRVAKVSPWYKSLMLHKQTFIRKNAATVNRLLDRHNFFDTDTILEIEAPGSKRKLVWVQADMDVVSDGSDGDRLPDMPNEIKNSNFYQPTTSYRWKKRTSIPNPLLPHWEERLKKLQKDKASASSIDFARRTIVDLKKNSFLLADYDPFIVLSLTMKEGKSAYMPAPGDYAVVIVGKKLYPCIVGDYGPRHKSGEASLRLCKEINSKATTVSRPISDLGASYLVFPGTKEKENGPIDYERMYARCSELMEEIGGLAEGAKLVKMNNLLPEVVQEPVTP